ncbi:MAG: MmgE/PrpD family protein [Acetobacteraceae bacterium]|nr:MmgE/PrpD family protein [Acetobacteraceae bacterium]
MLDHVEAPAIAPSATLAEFAAGLTLADIPVPVRDRAKLLILDALGCAIASNAYPFSHAAVAGAVALGGTGACSVIGRPERLPLRDAALVNGVLMHGLDFDDTHLGSIIHATAACLPAALSLGEKLGADGGALLAAYAAGMETAIRIGAAAKGGFHHTGFHATGIVAHFSSAIVAAKLLGLSPGQIAAAQGIAASTASGVQVFLEDGAWTKRLHPGWAAVAGITAAHLAAASFKAPARPYEGRFGLFDTHLQHPAAPIDVPAELRTLGTVWELAETAIKPYPVCHFIHGAAEAAITLHAGFDPDSVARIEILLPHDTLPIVAEPAAQKQRPANEYEAKFSAPFVVATCLLQGSFGLADLLPPALARPDVLALAAQTACLADPASQFPHAFSGGVRLHLRDGTERFQHVAVNSGAGARALDENAVVAKFAASASLVLPRDQIERIRDAVLTLERGSARELAGLLRAGSNAEAHS